MFELFTFRMSHFSEKIRWSLDASGLAYHETRWTPFFHVIPALLRGRKATSVPILRTDTGSHVQDSTQILQWLEANEPKFKLLPKDSAARAEVLEIEERFDAVGTHVMRYVYGTALNHPESVIELWTLDAGPFQRWFIRRFFPTLARLFRDKFKITDAHVGHSGRRITEALDFLDQKLADGRRFLVGSSISAADITVASLLAPLFGPEEHDIYSREDYRALLAPIVAQWADRPAVKWVHQMYEMRRRYG